LKLATRYDSQAKSVREGEGERERERERREEKLFETQYNIISTHSS